MVYGDSGLVVNQVMKEWDIRSPAITGYCNHYKKIHICDILGRTKKNRHAYDTSMTLIVTKPGIIIDVVGSYFYDKKS